MGVKLLFHKYQRYWLHLHTNLRINLK